MQKAYLSTFPHDHIRPIQKQMLSDVEAALENKQHIILHAPTGIGKTASALSPALAIAKKKGLTIFFLTSRHTQHHIVIETLKKIKNKHNISVGASDIIGKKGMCAQEGAEGFHASEFHDYCKKLREDKQCDFFENTRKNGQALTVLAKKSLDDLKILIPLHVEQLNEQARADKLCPYEMALEVAKDGEVIITDYYYLFNESIRKGFLHKSGKDLSKAIIIVDEAHNLPERLRSLATQRLTSLALERAITEARKAEKPQLARVLESLLRGIFLLFEDGKEEGLIAKEKILTMVEGVMEYDEAYEGLLMLGEELQISQKRSYVHGIGRFLQAWQGEGDGYARILSKKEKGFSLSYRCLDPSLFTKDVVDGCYSMILMSGTLTPTSMYRDILGVKKAIEKEYPNPFPKKNRLALIVPKTTTKFTSRSELQYKDIAVMCAGMMERIPGNVALFFPSYFMRDAIYRYLHPLVKRTMFMEKPKFSKEEKHELIERFKGYKNAALLGVSSGSFGEGLDMPGILKGVIVVGVPLQRPDLETQSLINYYDKVFGKGWDYGYFYPAMTHCLQNAGRCIRSEKDSGALIFLDERFSQSSYRALFPKEWEMIVDPNFTIHLDQFFSQK